MPNRVMAFAPLSLLAIALLLITSCDKQPTASPSSPSPTASTAPSTANASNPGTTTSLVAAKTAPGSGNLEGKVLWNSKPAADLDVKLCQDVSSFSGCSGKEFTAKTDKDGQYHFSDIPIGEYAVLVRVFNSDSWIFPAQGIAGLSSKKFAIAEGKTLSLPLQNIFKTDLKLESPESGEAIATNQPTLKWQTYPGASSYLVYLSASDLGKPYETAIVNLKLQKTELVLSKPLTKCNYTWKIQALNAEGVKIAEADNYGKFSIKGCESKKPEG